MPKITKKKPTTVTRNKFRMDYLKYTLREMAEKYNVSFSTIRYHAKKMDLEKNKVGRRARLIIV